MNIKQARKVTLKWEFRYMMLLVGSIETTEEQIYTRIKQDFPEFPQNDLEPDFLYDNTGSMEETYICESSLNELSKSLRKMGDELKKYKKLEAELYAEIDKLKAQLLTAKMNNKFV
jgi:hypothetical protein